MDEFRKANANMAFSSDFIVGFPGERDEDHQATMDLIEKVGYALAYSFKYSPRPGTPAAQKPQIDEKIKDMRLQAMQALLNAQQAEFNQSMLGKTMEVLMEKPGRHAGQLVGRSVYLQPVHVNLPDDYIGKMVSCRIDSIASHSLFATAIL